MKKIDIFRFLRSHTYPIGVDMSSNSLKIIQLANNGHGISLIACGSEDRPESVQPGSSGWQRWMIEAVKRLTIDSKFRGKNVIAAMPANEVFIDCLKMPKTGGDKIQEAVFSKIKHRLPFGCDDAVVKYIPSEGDNALVITVEREKIDRHLAIYKQANLQIKSIGVWPVALTNTYTRFFGRRKADIDAVVMLLDIGADCTNVVICHHKNLLFAYSIPIGAKQIVGFPKDDERSLVCQSDEMITKLELELIACRRRFDSIYKKVHIERLVFLSGSTVVKGVYTAIAKVMEMPAQIGDCLSAVEVVNRSNLGIDRRKHQSSWATSLGLSLS